MRVDEPAQAFGVGEDQVPVGDERVDGARIEGAQGPVHQDDERMAGLRRVGVGQRGADRRQALASRVRVVGDFLGAVRIGPHSEAAVIPEQVVPSRRRNGRGRHGRERSVRSGPVHAYAHDRQELLVGHDDAVEGGDSLGWNLDRVHRGRQRREPLALHRVGELPQPPQVFLPVGGLEGEARQAHRDGSPSVPPALRLGAGAARRIPVVDGVGYDRHGHHHGHGPDGQAEPDEGQ